MSGRVDLLAALRTAVGQRNVLVGDADTRGYATGYRFGQGRVAAVVRPGTILEQWQVFKACVAADVIVIVQAANTGLTGGSTPNGEYDREVVIINTMRITGVHLIDDGRQAVCLSGSTLVELEQRLRPFGREPHSVIGSSCIGASVIGGVCNNSGGALVRRGPAYTEYSLFARVGSSGEPELCNHLGVRLGPDAETILTRLQAGDFDDEDVDDLGRAASAQGYDVEVRRTDANTPARYNSDPTRLFEAAGCAGKVMVLAVRVDTFPADERTQTFYIGTNSAAELSEIRRRLLAAEHLPVSAEYIHRDAYLLAELYGKDTVLAIERLGTHRLPGLFALKSRIDALARRLPLLPANTSDRIMQFAGRLFPSHLPTRMTQFRDRFEHHLILKTADRAIAPTRRMLNDLLPSPTGAVFECTDAEATKAFLHRFAVAGAAVRYRALHPDTVEDIIALDVALRRDDEEWLEMLPEDVAEPIMLRLYYGHFLCHVFHQDYVVRKGVDPVALEHRMWKLLDERGARYPAEHNVGHLYPAGEQLLKHYRALDPTNRMNPGVGQSSRKRDWAS